MQHTSVVEAVYLMRVLLARRPSQATIEQFASRDSAQNAAVILTSIEFSRCVLEPMRDGLPLGHEARGIGFDRPAAIWFASAFSFSEQTKKGIDAARDWRGLFSVVLADLALISIVRQEYGASSRADAFFKAIETLSSNVVAADPPAAVDAAPVTEKGATTKAAAIPAASVVPAAVVEVQPATASADPAKDEPANASWLINGRLTSWTGSFTKRIEKGRSPITNGWAALVKPAGSAAIISLTSIVTRDPGKGELGDLRYAISCATTDLPRFVRIEAEIDPGRIKPLDACLQFYARGDSKTVGTYLKVNRIFVLARVENQGKTEDVDFGEIAKNVHVDAVGRNYKFDLRPKVLDAMNAGTVKHICVVFEIAAQEFDFSLSDVFLGSNPDRLLTEPSRNGAFEDPNIEAQTSLLKGLGDWQKLGPPAPRPHSGAQGRKWQWIDRVGSVDIVVPVYNAIEEVENCIQSIVRATHVPYTLTLVNDGSSRETSRRLDNIASKHPWIRVIDNGSNIGYTRAANVGLAASTAEYIVLLNSDTIVGEDWLSEMLSCIVNHPKAAGVGALSNAASWQSVPSLNDAKGKWRVNALPAGWTVDDYARLVSDLSNRAYPAVPLLNGFCTLFRRSALVAVGFLDEEGFPVGYGEENDLCVRLTKAGYVLHVCDSAYVYHVKSASFGSAKRAELVRAGTAKCAEKHPEVDWKSLQRVLGESIPLIELRAALSEHISKRES